MKSISLQAKIENLEEVIDFITTELKATECSMKLQNQIILATEEVFTNIAHYAYTPNIGNVEIRITTSDEVIIEFEDTGKPYNPLENIDPDVSLGPEKRDVGGLGIFLVKKTMDSVEYKHYDNKNLLVIRKKLSKL
jgi:anti-sigma regulatory factor (Ser/Thr protein kinase)